MSSDAQKTCAAEWPDVRLEEVTSILGDGLHGTPIYDDTGDYFFINGSNLGDGRIVINSATKRVAPSEFERHKKNLNDRTILVSINGTLGNVGLYMGERVVLGKSACYFNVLENVDKHFIRYVVASSLFQSYISNLATGSTIKNVSLRLMRDFSFKLPPLVVQEKISQALKSLDDRISLLRETNATLEAIAQALFKSWFVDFDPVRAKAEGLEPQAMDATTAALFPDSLEESELGLVPKGWRMSTLGAICDSNGGAIQTGPFGSQLHAADYVVDGVPVVMPKDISNRRVDASTAARVRLEDVQRLARHQLRDGDIVFSRRGDVEKHALIGETERGWLCGTGCLLVRPGTRRNVAGYLSRSLDLPQIKQWLTQHAVGATMPNLNTGILSAVPVVLPADEILAAFEQATNALDKRISAGNAAAQTLTQLRDTLLPRLISGQLRLPEAEALLEEAV